MRLQRSSATITMAEDFQVDDNEPFYFETDHVALKGNADYQKCLRVLILLQSQRAKAMKDLDILIEARSKALDDPIDFVNKLQHNEISLPPLQQIAQLPEIDWTKYVSHSHVLIQNQHKHSTRHSSKANEVLPQEKPTLSTKNTSNESRTETFNKLWSIEEQRLLEELLVKYPAEAIEARRWEKIANEMPNRDPKQAGLPVPGRLPNMRVHCAGRPKYSAGTRLSKFYSQPSTFLQAYEQPVYMASEDSDPTVVANVAKHRKEIKTEVIEEEDESSDEHKLLKRLMEEKRRRQDKRDVEQQCAGCGQNPISGICYRCLDCPSHLAVSLCAGCRQRAAPIQHETHLLSHQMELVSRPLMDKDYDSVTFANSIRGDYNYLDPNFLPAT